MSKKKDAPQPANTNAPFATLISGDDNVAGSAPMPVKPPAAGQPLQGKVLPGSADDGSSPFKPASGT